MGVRGCALALPFAAVAQLVNRRQDTNRQVGLEHHVNGLCIVRWAVVLGLTTVAIDEMGAPATPIVVFPATALAPDANLPVIIATLPPATAPGFENHSRKIITDAARARRCDA